ncbi:hypothetical protein AVEN_27231-1 [Araneus ventricosus]|uniref:Uncharacterized protein n=1 Tax=Araneus ventricosus TaxID=182803 RepID=A0A4Y2C9N0_ARAVE|nr:hypothetical protein AVEN_27231-1 [Araneus ventricosus]
MAVRCCPFRIEVFTCCSKRRLHMKKKWRVLCILLAEVETDEDSDFHKEDNGPEYILEEHFSDHKSFSEHDADSQEDGDS